MLQHSYSLSAIIDIAFRYLKGRLMFCQGISPFWLISVFLNITDSTKQPTQALSSGLLYCHGAFGPKLYSISKWSSCFPLTVLPQLSSVHQIFPCYFPLFLFDRLPQPLPPLSAQGCLAATVWSVHLVASVRVHVYVDKAECVCFCVTHTKSFSGQPASLHYRCCCFAEFCIVSNHVPSGLYLWRHQSLWLRLQFQSCKSTDCLSENMTKRLPAWRQLGTLICGLISFLVDPLSPRSTALWIQLVLLWS